MNSGNSPEWLLTTVSAVRDLMIKRLEAESLDGDAKREMEMALEELDVMWEELQGQAALLVREKERYAEFFEYAPDAYLITDAGGSIREANQAAREFLNAPRDAVVGHSLSQYVAPEDRVNFLARAVWRTRLQPREREALAAEFSVRAIPLKKSGVAGLCWLMRPIKD